MPISNSVRYWDSIGSLARGVVLHFKADRQSCGSVDMQRLTRRPWPIRSQLKIPEPLQQIRQRDSRLQPRKRCAKTKMNSMTERDMRVRIASDIEAIGILELCRVAVGGADHGQYQRTLRYDPAVHFDVAHSLAHHPL